MGNTSEKNIRRKTSGWIAVSPLLVFLAIYVISSLIARDFYQIPVASAFLIASCYALCITRGKNLEEKISVFSSGAGNHNVLLMIWIFVLAGAFAETAKEIGAIEATVDLTLRVLPPNLLFAGMFIGLFVVSLAENIKVMPILVKRTGVAKGIGLIILSMALGKSVGHIIYYLFIY